MNLQQINALLSRVTMNCLGHEFAVIVDTDKKYGMRVFLQISYSGPCTKDPSKIETWKGRKWYLSEYMTEDEIIKTAWAAFEAAVKHEVMEGFKVDGIVLFNPHVNFEELLQISHKEITRNETIS